MERILTSYWITFPEDRSAPLGIGVTAYSVEDAFRLLEERGYDYHRRMSRAEIRENIKIADLDQFHVVPNMGPIVVRGIWYPCLNIGFGASGQGRPAPEGGNR